MSSKRTYSDADLTAYLDGEADSETAAEIEAALQNDADLAARMEALQIDVGALRNAGDSLLGASPAAPDILQHAATKQGPDRAKRFMPAVAAALLFFVIGFGASRLTTPAPEETWQDFAAVYHALYVNKTLAHIAQSDEAAVAELSRVSNVIGRTLEHAELGAEGLDYKRAQVLGYKGKPLLQLAYLSKIGAPVALCIYKSGNPGDTPVRSEQHRGLSAAYWTKDGYEYLLIGGSDQSLIRNAAEELADKI
ncbi:MAG: hypothetical protein AAF441_27155 [Pseudomonadota bacterium]